MAKEEIEKVKETVTVASTGNKFEDFYNKNKKMIMIAGGGVLAAIAAIFFYQKQIKEPKELEASNAIFKAEYYFGLDSFNLALNGRGEMLGFLGIIDEFGGTKAGNNAHYYAGVCYLRTGKFQDAIDQFEQFKSDDVNLSAMAIGCTGDAYRELGDSQKAVEYYEKAAAKNTNSFTSPYFLKKAAGTYENDLKDVQKALDIYIKIEKEYINTVEGRDIQKYIARAKAALGQ